MSAKPLSQCETPDQIYESLREMWKDPRYQAERTIIEYWRTNQDIKVVYDMLIRKRRFQEKLRSYVLTSLRSYPDKQREFAWMAQQLGMHS